MDKKTAIASELLTIGAVSLQPNDPFTWSSGLKAPIYCDNRLTLSSPSFRTKLAEAFTSKILRRFPETEVVAGTATAGIPHAALVADRLELPMVYVRGKAKGHGKQNLIEGDVRGGQKVVVIEDLVSTGNSAIEATKALEAAGADVLGIVAIFSYGLVIGGRNLAEANVHLETLTDFDALITASIHNGVIAEEDLEGIRTWQQDPEAWGSRKFGEVPE
ncbi:orotate phosphoribosyltransferase [Natribacillus halophilus]|uniref:Orotate phosphoribosyltransferase n=1 Tax=Natribacillus halophilus TaxID=549003 RepID=A0A1G8MGY2_9BACI|nr:orotate phosphoribosyltransferase [Natribacillus halophilus]SDI67203.1 orotate phosphoribosyltransferase [Natribacillus halophilus]